MNSYRVVFRRKTTCKKVGIIFPDKLRVFLLSLLNMARHTTGKPHGLFRGLNFRHEHQDVRIENCGSVMSLGVANET